MGRSRKKRREERKEKRCEAPRSMGRRTRKVRMQVVVIIRKQPFAEVGDNRRCATGRMTLLSIRRIVIRLNTAGNRRRGFQSHGRIEVCGQDFRDIVRGRERDKGLQPKVFAGAAQETLSVRRRRCGTFRAHLCQAGHPRRHDDRLARGE